MTSLPTNTAAQRLSVREVISTALEAGLDYEEHGADGCVYRVQLRSSVATADVYIDNNGTIFAGLDGSNFEEWMFLIDFLKGCGDLCHEGNRLIYTSDSKDARILTNTVLPYP